MNSFKKFLYEQEDMYPLALKEIKNGKKVSHWIWFIFPQIRGLGTSEISEYFAINDVKEAKDYLNNEILGPRLIEITSELLKINDKSIEDILGYVDSLKLQSCMTLFQLADPSNRLFQDVLDKYFFGEKDEKTIEICKQFELER